MKAITRKKKTKKSKKLTLKDRLSRLTYIQAAKLLGPEGQRLIGRGASLRQHRHRPRRVFSRRSVPAEVAGHRRERERRRGDHHHDGRGEKPPANELHGLRDGLRAHRRGGLVDLGREDGFGPGRPARRTPAHRDVERAGVARTGAARSSGAGEDRKVPPAIVRSAKAVGRLHHHQCAFGQELSRGAARGRARRFILFLSRFPHEHARHVQAHPARAASGEAAVSASCKEEALSQRRGVRPRGLWRGGRPSAAIARSARARACRSGRQNRRRARSTTCGGWSVASSSWNNWGTGSRSIPTPRN